MALKFIFCSEVVIELEKCFLLSVLIPSHRQRITERVFIDLYNTLVTFFTLQSQTSNFSFIRFSCVFRCRLRITTRSGFSSFT